MTVLELPTPDPRTFDDTARPFVEAVASHYAIKRLIGRGGMGIVYLARDRRLDRLVAIKTLLPQLADDPAIRERFLRETRAAGGMSHANIVPVHGADEIDGHVFFVMGYVDGESLATLLASQQRLAPRHVVRLLHDVASALAHAHRRGIIHRDIKAENILIEESSGRALVTDFGIARLADAKPLTATGQLLGTRPLREPRAGRGRADRPSRRPLFPRRRGLPRAHRSLSLRCRRRVGGVGRTRHATATVGAQCESRCARGARCGRRSLPGEERGRSVCVSRRRDPGARRHRARCATGAHLAHARLRSGSARHLAARRGPPGIHATARATVAAAQPRDRDKDHARTSGLSVREVLAAATEAGIPAEFTERALAERGLGQGASLVRSQAPSAPRPSWWAGVPLEIITELETSTQGEGQLDAAHVDRLVNALRDGTAALGVTDVRPGEVVWHATWPGHRLRVEITHANGRVSIRATQDMRGAALATIAGSVVGSAALAVGGGMLSYLILHRPSPAWVRVVRELIRALGLDLSRSEAIAGIASGIGVAVGLLAFRVGRSWLRRLRDKDAAHLRTLVKLLGFTAKE